MSDKNDLILQKLEKIEEEIRQLSEKKVHNEDEYLLLKALEAIQEYDEVDENILSHKLKIDMEKAAEILKELEQKGYLSLS